MRTFNANFITEKNRRADGPAPVNLLTCNFSTPVYLSDRDVTPSGGSAHTGRILRWGFVDSAMTQTPGSGVLGTIDVADLEIEIINMGSSPFSGNFTTTDPPENVLFELYQWFDGLLYSEKEPIFRGYPTGQIYFDRDVCRIRLESVFSKYNITIGDDLIVSADDFSGADPDDIGKMLPVCYGSVRRSPCRAVDAGGKTTIVGDWTDTSPGDGDTVDITDGTYLPTTAFILQVDSEQISIASRSGNTLTLASSGARGYNSTTAVAHDAGAPCAEIQTAYVYVAAGHPVKAIDTVYVDGVRQTTGYTVYTGQTGDALTGYEGLAVVKFTTLPTFLKQVNIDTDVDTGNHGHTSTMSSTVTCYGTGSSGDWENRSNAYDGNDTTYAYNTWFDNDEPLTINFSHSDVGTVTSRRVKIVYSSYAQTYSNDLRVKIGDASYQSFPGTGGGDSTRKTIYKTFSGDSWDLDVKIDYDGNGAPTTCINEVSVTVTYGAGVANSSADGVTVTLSGNTTAETVIGSLVTVDMDGYADDAAGTYTGTASALIEQPNHVFKHIWTELCGGTAGDFDDDTGTFFATNSYAFALLINQTVQAETLFMRLALQCRSRFFVSAYGTARMVVRQLSQTSGHSIASSEIKEGSVSVSRMATTDLFNYFNIHFDKDHSKTGNYADNFAASKLFSDATSISNYGRRTFSGQISLFCFDAVTDATMVAHVGAFLLAFHKIARRIPSFAVFLDNLEIEPADIIDITHSLDSMSGFTVEVQKILHRIGSARQNIIDHLEITAIEN
jgi:hypothetical protein